MCRKSNSFDSKDRDDYDLREDSDRGNLPSIEELKFKNRPDNKDVKSINIDLPSKNKKVG